MCGTKSPSCFQLVVRDIHSNNRICSRDGSSLYGIKPDSPGTNDDNTAERFNLRPVNHRPEPRYDTTSQKCCPVYGHLLGNLDYL
ncbi:hypothetical protein ES703_118167 [subsurface metagenome]